MDSAKDKNLSFPQRNWFLLCVIVAILSPLVVDWVRHGAAKVSYDQSTDIRSKDTSYKVASPATTDSSKKSPAMDSVAH